MTEKDVIWIWSWLMDYHKAINISPSASNALFHIVRDARKLAESEEQLSTIVTGEGK